MQECRDICRTLPEARQYRGPKFSYKLGYAKCITCEISIKTDELFCPCCKRMLRRQIRDSSHNKGRVKRID